jgi:hypothetical protein
VIEDHTLERWHVLKIRILFRIGNIGRIAMKVLLPVIIEETIIIPFIIAEL